MPVIPQYRSQKNIQQPDTIQAESIQVRQLSTEAPAVRIDASNVAHEARAMSQFGVTVGNIAENIIQVKADQEYAKSKIDFYKGLKDLEVEGSQDDDYQNFEPKYSKRIKELQDNITKTIKSPAAKRQFQQDAELKSAYSFHDIMANGRKRFLAYDKDLMSQEVAATYDRYVSATTGQEKQNATDELASIFSRRVTNKTLGKKEALLLYQEAVKGLDEAQVEYDIDTRPGYAHLELQKGKFGAYKNVESNKRSNYIKYTKQVLDRIEADKESIAIIAKNQREADVLDAIAKNSISMVEIQKDVDTQIIDKDFGEMAIKSLNQSSFRETKDENFIGMVNFILDPKNNPREIRKELLKNRSNLSDDDFDILNTFNKETGKPLEKILAKQRPKGLMEKLSFWSDEYAENRVETKAAMYKNYMKRIQAGENSDDAVKNTIDTFKKKAIYEIGQIMSTPKGNVKVVGYDADGEAIIELVR